MSLLPGDILSFAHVSRVNTWKRFTKVSTIFKHIRQDTADHYNNMYLIT